MSEIAIVQKSITSMDGDAIVNAANERLKAGGGVCGAIFQDAGYRDLQLACDRIGHCDTGDAVITPGFGLAARYVIHAVGPIWQGGGQGEQELLASCYRRSLQVASENGCRSIAFPLISSGIYGYPKEEAWRVALSTCLEELAQPYAEGMSVTFCVLGEAALTLGKRILGELSA